MARVGPTSPRARPVSGSHFVKEGAFVIGLVVIQAVCAALGELP
jgi:hypothetical protein